MGPAITTSGTRFKERPPSVEACIHCLTLPTDIAGASLVSTGRFGFKCEACAASAPCPLAHVRAAADAAAKEQQQDCQRPSSSSTNTNGMPAAKCANETIPCEQCATDAPCPFLGSFGQLQLSALQQNSAEVNAKARSAGAAQHAQAEAGDEGMASYAHTHVWRSLCRRALWKRAGKRVQNDSPALERRAEEPGGGSIGAMPFLKRVFWGSADQGSRVLEGPGQVVEGAKVTSSCAGDAVSLAQVWVFSRSSALPFSARG
jgi:hypothetical protein